MTHWSEVNRLRFADFISNVSAAIVHIYLESDTVIYNQYYIHPTPGDNPQLVTPSASYKHTTEFITIAEY